MRITSARVKMEKDNQHLVGNVEDFVLNHLEEITVTCEAKKQITEAETWLQQYDSSSRIYRNQWDETRSPPPESIYGQQPVQLNRHLIHDPGTPPDMPMNHSLYPCKSTDVMDEMVWFPENIRTDPQPLDIIHYVGGEPEWEREGYLPLGMMLELGRHNIHRRSQSVCSGDSVLSPRTNNRNSGYSTCSEDIGINDDLLISISIKELNKRLHGSSREEIVKLKHKRRTLKNRCYAQNCRSKRQNHTQQLEQANRSLQQELHRLKSELIRITHERDVLLELE